MHNKVRFQNLLFCTTSRAATAALAIALALATVVITAAQAQTYTVIHNFTGGGDGAWPQAGLTTDAAGSLYGTAYYGGTFGNGTVYRLQHAGLGWVLNTLYSFAGGNDGANPEGRVAIARDGTLYGTTWDGGNYGQGTVFHVSPSPAAPTSVVALWSETVLHRFSGGSDGALPEGDLTFDGSGNVYGSTAAGGSGGCSGGCGIVYKLTPSGGGWMEAILYAPQEIGGRFAEDGVVFDRSGNLYGVFAGGGLYGDGMVYELLPSGSGWTENTLHSFTNGSDGATPQGGLIIDAYGNLYGTTSISGAGGGGTVYELSASSGGWICNTFYSFSGSSYVGPHSKLVMDAGGDLYGTTWESGAYGWGSVFKLTPSVGGWTYTSLHDFTGGSDGALPLSNLVFDSIGNLYGTTSRGGAYQNCTQGCGVVFQITL
jgi:uncharacterized repeat protein (TIGR03803 family)